MYLLNWAPWDAPQFDLKKYLSNWAPRDASQVGLHEVFLKLSSTKCSSWALRDYFSNWAPRDDSQVDSHCVFIKLSSTKCFSSWAPRGVPQVELQGMLLKVPCSWRSLEICIWPYVVIGPASLPWGVPLQLLNFSYDADLCFMYYHIT